MFKCFLLCALFLLCACNTSEEARPGGKEVTAPLAAPNSTSRRPATDGEKHQATHIIAFVNQAQQELSTGFHALPEIFAANTQHYLKSWRLPARPKHTPRNNAAFTIPAGLFDKNEMDALEAAYVEMDKDLNNLLGHYAQLEKYVLDTKIRDDGKQGQILADRILTIHKNFRAARSKWLEIVNARAAWAEDILMRDHPLERQLRAAKDILTEFKKVTSILTDAPAPRDKLLASMENLQKLSETGAKPPFPAKPDIERNYRYFLTDVNAFVKALKNIIKFGDHDFERRALNRAIINCQKSYNAFAASANTKI